MFAGIKHSRCRFLGTAVVIMVAAQLSLIGSARARSSRTADLRGIKMRQLVPAAVQLPIEGQLPSLGRATGWLNSQPLTATGLRGKVVLIDFWTYSCINWRRTLPLYPRVG